MDAAVPEVPVGKPVQMVALQESVEVSQVGAQLFGGYRRVLPARVGGTLQAHPGQACAVGADLPQGARYRRIGHDPALQAPRRGHQVGGAGGEFRTVLAHEFDEHPAGPLR